MNAEASQATISPDALESDSLVWIPGGRFRMGSDAHYAEEAPAHEVGVDGFWIERCPVTNARFREFVEATGYVTLAELAPVAEDYPGADPRQLVPSSMVFTPPTGPVPANTEFWWRFLPGASWRHPLGPGSTLVGLDQHPVVHVAWKDVQAYAAWKGRALPTEAEWERAARGGLVDAEFAWGDEFTPGGRQMANTWQGRFPFENTLEDGWSGTSPVGTYPENGYGLSDMIGNVWEWTGDWFHRNRIPGPGKPCCAPRNPRGGSEAGSICSTDPAQIPRKVIKGGSHLCAPSYCRRYRPAARHPHPIDTSTSHVGFRCVVRPPAR